ncbi:hypothetical protein NHQ30_005789 [Ciborinia camelliae]|nr:hypothetical protein NHQ30_005789 [Ciborinia camelliae]
MRECELKEQELTRRLSVTFINVADPYNMEATPEPEQYTDSTIPIATTIDETDNGAHSHPSFEEALSTGATTNMEYMRQLSVPVNSPRGINTPQHSVNHFDFILNPTGLEGRLGMKMFLISTSLGPRLIVSS